MVDPQKENGYTPIANELIEVLSKSKFNGTQFKIIHAVMRYTYGFNRKSHELSASFLSKATETGLRQVSRELANLIEMNVITVYSQGNYTKANELGINKHYDEWKLDSSDKKDSSDKLDTTDKKDTSTSDKLDTTSSDKKVTRGSDKSVRQERHIKDNIKTNTKDNIVQLQKVPYKEIMDLFNSICTTLPKIKSIEGNRQKTVSTRWKDNSDLKFFEDVFKTVNESDFLSGRNDKWKTCCFDWIFKPANLQKILEGNYNNKGNKRVVMGGNNSNCNESEDWYTNKLDIDEM